MAAFIGDSTLSGELQAEFIILYVCDLGERFTSRFGEGAGLDMESLKYAETLWYRTLSFTSSAFHTYK